jgi:hypothetical protein
MAAMAAAVVLAAVVSAAAAAAQAEVRWEVSYLTLEPLGQAQKACPCSCCCYPALSLSLFLLFSAVRRISISTETKGV